MDAAIIFSDILMVPYGLNQEVVFKKNFEIKPIKITLPQVKKNRLWKPIIKSVTIKLRITAGKYLRPNKAGV